jgi:hypothetical protein
LGFGVLFATLITLVLVPSLYLIVEDLRQLVGTREISHVDLDKKVKQPI